MGWLHKSQPEEKSHRCADQPPHLSRTVADLSLETSAREPEVEDLLQHMERKGMVVSSPVGSSREYRLHEAEETMRKILNTLSNAEPGKEGMTLRVDATGWTAELNEPAGLLDTATHGSRPWSVAGLRCAGYLHCRVHRPQKLPWVRGTNWLCR